MFGKMMNQFYYGKSGQGDFRKEDLPKNRWQLFLAMLKIRLGGLCALNALYALCWLPALAVSIWGAWDAYFALVYFVSQPLQDAAAATSLSLPLVLQSLTLRTLVLWVPSFAITGPFTAGVAYVTRNWARDEHASVWTDFKDAVRENWRQGLAISGITALMPLILAVCWFFYGQLAQGSPLFIIPQVLSIAFVLLWLCSLIYLYPLMVTYRLRFRDLLRNGFLLAIGRLPFTVGLKLLSLLPAVIALTVFFFFPYPQWTALALVAYYVVIGLSLSRFIGASYVNGVFDRYINARMEGIPVNQGLYLDKDEEGEGAAPPPDV